MWKTVAEAILRYRVLLLLALLSLTALLAWQATKAQLSYDFTSTIPDDDADLQYFQQFKARFGDDGSLLLVIGVRDTTLYELNKFEKFSYLAKALRGLPAVRSVLSLPQLQYLQKDTVEKRFRAKPIFQPMPSTQRGLDSLLAFARMQKMYDNLLFNRTGATLIFCSLDRKMFESKKRAEVMRDIQHLGDEFEKATNITLHYGGLPHIRATVMREVQSELTRLLGFSGMATALILLFFYRSFKAIIVPMLTIATSVIWAMGIMASLGYKITLLSGLLPPILVVIGIPNCVYLLTKYHQEFRKTGNKHEALIHIVQKIGMVTFLTNTTTAIGFGVFMFTSNVVIREFGVVSCVAVMVTFAVSLLLFPILSSWMPEPRERHLKHLDRKHLLRLLSTFDRIVFKHQTTTFAVVLVVLAISLVGVFQIRTLSFMLDNVPHNSKPKTDLKFFEDNFKGLMPLEIVVDTKQKRGAMNLNNLRKIERLEQTIVQKTTLIGEPLSLVRMVKAGKQAFYNHVPEFYELPTNQERVFLLNYLKGSDDSESRRLLNTLVDSTGEQMRISLKVADVGSTRLDSLITHVIKPSIAEVMKDSKMTASVTGTTPIFIKGNVYLINSLQSSLVLAIVLIGLIMALLFGSARMILISMMTNMLPLVITAGLMGYLGIPLKPSSALIFSIAFGIAVDDSIHYLARYRQELRLHKYNVPTAVRIALLETGTGMFYTSMVLFFGFIVFAYSNFEGTIVLGLLTSATLLCAMLGNLILLPTLLLRFETGKYERKIAAGEMAKS